MGRLRTRLSLPPWVLASFVWPLARLDSHDTVADVFYYSLQQCQPSRFVMHGRKELYKCANSGSLVARYSWARFLCFRSSPLRDAASRENSRLSRLAWFRTDLTLLLLYGLAGILAWRQEFLGAITAALVGAQIGLLAGAVQVANQLIEAFVPARPFVLVISPVSLTLALLGAAGAASWEGSKSPPQALVAGLYCAVVAVLITLGFAISFSLLLTGRVDWQVREAFAASGMTGPAPIR